MSKKFVLFTIVFCIMAVVLVGCSSKVSNNGSGNGQQTSSEVQNPQKPDSDSTVPDIDSGDWSIVDGTNNGGGGENEVDDDNGSKKPNANGMYSWDINGRTLETRVNVYDYIDGDRWLANEMAINAGWDESTQNINDSHNYGFYWKGDMQLAVQYSKNTPRPAYSVIVSERLDKPASERTGYTYKVGGTDDPVSSETYFVNKNTDSYVSIDYIVITEYIFENMSSLSDDPFAGIFDGAAGNGYHWRQ